MCDPLKYDIALKVVITEEYDHTKCIKVYTKYLKYTKWNNSLLKDITINDVQNFVYFHK